MVGLVQVTISVNLSVGVKGGEQSAGGGVSGNALFWPIFSWLGWGVVGWWVGGWVGGWGGVGWGGTKIGQKRNWPKEGAPEFPPAILFVLCSATSS